MKKREAKILLEEQRLERERKTFEASYHAINEEKRKLQEFATQIEAKSKEVEELSKVTTNQSIYSILFYRLQCLVINVLGCV